MNDPFYRAPAPMLDEQYYELTGRFPDDEPPWRDRLDSYSRGDHAAHIQAARRRRLEARELRRKRAREAAEALQREADQ